ncbi:MAG: hypothetical protein SCK70_01905 [bacterium]|nr:hypothetical protein [bacterium]
MSTVLQIALSFIIFGLLLLLIIGVDTNVRSVTHQATFDKNSQENIVSLAELFDHDFSKIGHRTSSIKFKAGNLDSNQIAYYADYDNDGSVDSISYFIGDTEETGNPNPNTYSLYRKINNNEPAKVGVNIVSFKISYFDSAMTQLDYNNLNQQTEINKIRAVKVQVRVESQYKFNQNFSSTFWEKTYFPRNLRL